MPIPTIRASTPTAAQAPMVWIGRPRIRATGKKAAAMAMVRRLGMVKVVASARAAAMAPTGKAATIR